MSCPRNFRHYSPSPARPGRFPQTAGTSDVTRADTSLMVPDERSLVLSPVVERSVRADSPGSFVMRSRDGTGSVASCARRFSSPATIPT
jgi:hypothetical protein